MIDVTLDEVTAQGISGSQSRLDVHLLAELQAVAEGRAGEGLGHGVKRDVGRRRSRSR